MPLNFTSGGGSGGGAGSSLTKVTPKITNFTVAVSGVEESHVLDDETKSFLVRSRNKSTIQLAFVATESSTKFITIAPNAVYQEDTLVLTGKTLYFQTDKSSEVVEILEWK